MRIVSLLPAATEICFALGIGDDVVGVSPECDFPSAACGKPVVCRALLEYEGKTSGETSRMVGERLADGEALYQVDEPSLRAARPDLILTQGLCEVCAPTMGDVEEVARRLPDAPEIVSLDPHRLEDVLADILRVARACGTEDRADALVANLRDRIERVARRASRAAVRPKTVCLEWLAPLFLGGHWVPEMVSLAGGIDVLGRAGEKSRRIEAKEIVMASPDVAVLMPCGFDLERTWKEAPTVTREPWWADLPAARTDRVWLVDGSGYFNRPGPRLVDGLEILAHILQPSLFPRTPAWNAAQRWVG
jgi:iron complex transport system substrate-binding protein